MVYIIHTWRATARARVKTLESQAARLMHIILYDVGVWSTDVCEFHHVVYIMPMLFINCNSYTDPTRSDFLEPAGDSAHPVHCRGYPSWGLVSLARPASTKNCGGTNLQRRREVISLA